MGQDESVSLNGSVAPRCGSPHFTRSQHPRREMWLLLEAGKDMNWEGCRDGVTGGDSWDRGTTSRT